MIEKIERAIEAASICVAEVSEDNPNVWLELGYALALNRPTVILCDRAVRAKLPFDIQHRPVIFYRTDSRSGYDELERDLVKFVSSQLQTERRIANTLALKPGSESATDLEKYEVAILATAFAFWPTPVGSISHWEMEQKLRTIGYNDVALALGVTSLVRRNFIIERAVEEETADGPADIKHYQVAPAGVSWIESHKDLLELTYQEPKRKASPFDGFDDEIPF
ncbi:hypothetical protein CKO43_24425 [Rubrivivax gelatinosus]|uniref:Uncharacterized protein n=1 Tax=Rubrivivax gelatinosus TaxID=28068 RepID=A0ABS1E0N8_RUBGE|nr:hypothetical protein [Rubrivivax gelatinosus]